MYLYPLKLRACPVVLEKTMARIDDFSCIEPLFGGKANKLQTKEPSK
jgi:hypothetical protein